MDLDYYLTTRAYTESLCEPLAIEDYVPQAIDYTSPPKWHLAHVSWFFERFVLIPYLPDYQIFDDQYNFLFNSYYRSAGERAIRSQRGLMTRPSVDEVYSYRQYVDKHMTLMFEKTMSKEVLQLITLGINHEQQHQELLLTDLKYIFSMNPTVPVYKQNFDALTEKNIETGWVSMKENLYPIGHVGSDFCFDNETKQHKVQLNDYQISKTLVTNGDYIKFIEAGGYDNFEHWLDDGWSWRHENNITAPLYWKIINGEWFHYTLGGLLTIDREAMLAHVSYYEASAYASWSGKRLPTEFEWEAACEHFNWGKRWEWTSSAYQPYPGFCIQEGAVGEYNGKFMINQIVLRGSSVVTSPDHGRRTYRNFFHPHLQWQYAGIRLSK